MNSRRNITKGSGRTNHSLQYSGLHLTGPVTNTERTGPAKVAATFISSSQSGSAHSIARRPAANAPQYPRPSTAVRFRARVRPATVDADPIPRAAQVSGFFLATRPFNGPVVFERNANVTIQDASARADVTCFGPNHPATGAARQNPQDLLHRGSERFSTTENGEDVKQFGCGKSYPRRAKIGRAKLRQSAGRAPKDRPDRHTPTHMIPDHWRDRDADSESRGHEQAIAGNRARGPEAIRNTSSPTVQPLDDTVPRPTRRHRGRSQD